MTETLKVRIENANSIRIYLDTVQKWEQRRLVRPSLVLQGNYIDLSPEHQGLLEVLSEDICRTQVAEAAEHLYNLGVHLDLDFDFQEHLAGKAAAQAAAEAKANAIAASVEDLG